MRLLSFFTLTLLFVTLLANAQSVRSYTHADTLRGSITPERAWWDVLRYDLTVRPDYLAKTIAGNNVITYKVVSTKGSSLLQLDLQEPLVIDSILYGKGSLLSFAREGNAWHVKMPVQQKGATCTMTIFFHGKAHEAKRAPWDGGWIFTKDSLGRPWMTVACQGLGASIWYPCKDHQSDEPDSGASLSVTVPDTLVAIANGRLTHKEIKGDGTATFKWNVENAISNYCIIPYIGKYVNFNEIYQGEKGPLTLNYWVLDYNIEKAKAYMPEQVHNMMKSFEYWFGPYPFYEDGYQLIETSHTGMEHQSAVSYGNGYKFGYRGRDMSLNGWGLKWDFIIIHESGHEWFGNNITSKDLADMWVHEGFTNYSETLFVDHIFGEQAGNEYNYGIRHAIKNDSPIIPEYGVNAQGSGDMYPKAGNMLHAIRHSMHNDSLFRQILRGLNKEYHNKTVTTAEIEHYISEHAGYDYSKVFDQYLRTTQIPRLEIYFNNDSSAVHYRWTDCVKGFNLPLWLGSLKIIPADSWKELKITPGQAALFDVAAISKMYYIQQPVVPVVQQPYLPSHTEMLERYRKMMELDSTARNTVFKTAVLPNWQKEGSSFWYTNKLGKGRSEYYMVDPLKGTRVKVDSAPGAVSGRIRQRERWGRWMEFNTPGLSPDKKWDAFIKEGNVFLNKKGTADTLQFTHNGTRSKPYGSLAWSPDSKYLVGYLVTPFEDSSINYILSSQPNTFRGQLRSYEYKQPGDPFTTYEMYLFNPASKSSTKVSTDIIDFFNTPVLHWRKDNARYFTYEKPDRGHQRFRIIEVDAVTAGTRTIIDEHTETFIYEGRIFTQYLPETNEIVWISEKDGWRHIYLIDALKGGVKKQVTKGAWVVSDIDSVDAVKKEIWFSAMGMNTGEDPYNVHYYRVGFDGKGLVSLTPQQGNHSVVYSPDKKFYVDNYSEVNVPPVTDLRRTSDGKKIMELERADITAYLATGIKLAEPFHAKGRDGITDIWGVVLRPSSFDSTKRYPVIENIYAGPQDAFVPKSFMGYGEMQSLAELGFIVVQIDGMGTANRSKAFHDVCWKNLADAGFADRIKWIKALASKYPYVDDTRVGLYGTSAGGQNSLGGLLFHPEFYKAAVSACGCHDNRIDKQWWNEQWMGYPVGKHYEEQSNVTNAYKLQGDLLLIVGEADNNVPPESTYRVADALIKAGKNFDFLAVPGMGHSDGGVYGRMRKRDFFVKHLLGAEPPVRNSNELTVTK